MFTLEDLIRKWIFQFWMAHPALLYGVSFMLGVYFSFTLSYWLILPALCLWLPYCIISLFKKPKDIKTLKILILSVVMFMTAWIYTSALHQFPSLSSNGVMGIAHVKIKSIQLKQNIFGKQWIYRCAIEQFFTEKNLKSIASALPCLITLPLNNEQKSLRPLADQEYWVKGKLVQSKNGSYILKIPAQAEWKVIPNTSSLAEKRYDWKKNVSRWIQSQYSHATSGSFLAGLSTGEFDDIWMRQNFARFGLQHILAISGFHFAIIAAFLSLLLRLFLPLSFQTPFLLFTLGVYCFFLGPQPSILRAWIMCSLGLIGGLLEKRANALNSLGLAIMLILGYDPTHSLELGFQLSFATTFAILIFYPPAMHCLCSLFQKRKLSEVLEMNVWNQYGYCVLAFVRQGIALTLAVNLIALPLTLYYFQQFPWMSLLYNLFFPFLATGSLCLFLLGCLFFIIPAFAQLIHQLNDHYTFFLLQLTHQIPNEMDVYLSVKTLSIFWVILYICAICLGGMIWKERELKKEGQIQN